jgi:hypothetical protein
MDATRSRRTRDSARRAWYASWRCRRFARHFGFPPAPADQPACPAAPHRGVRGADAAPPAGRAA